ERRPAISRDHGGRIQTAALIGAVLIERETDERLDPRQKDLPVELAVLGVEREVVLSAHGPLDRRTAVPSHLGYGTRPRGHVAAHSRAFMIAGSARTMQTPCKPYEPRWRRHEVAIGVGGEEAAASDGRESDRSPRAP